jgi:hypothetical protein
MKHYIDLFDDALYNADCIDVFDADREKLKNTIRLQVLITLLFRNQIIVPEQWALSSATFLQVANEVIDGYRYKINLTNRASPEKALIKPPIVVSFRKRDVAANSAFSLAMIDRLENESRLMFSALTKDTSNGKSQTARERLRRIFVDKTHTVNPAEFGMQLEQRVTDVIENDNTATNICGLARYLAEYTDPDPEFSAWSATEYHNAANYESDMAMHASTVRHVCAKDSVLHSYDDERISHFAEMFERAQRDGIAISSFMEMWPLAQGYPEATSDLITRIGQYCMHRSIANSTSADFGSTLYGAYSGKSDDNFDQILIARTRAHEYLKANKAGQDLDFRFLATTHADKYDFSDRFSWKEVWANVAEFAYSSDWEETLRHLEHKLAGLDAEEVHNEPLWREVFDRINGNFKEFQLKKHAEKEGLFLAVIGRSSGIELLSRLGGSVENIIVSSYAMLAGWSSVYRKTTPLEIELKATRALRSGKNVCTDLFSG